MDQIQKFKDRLEELQACDSARVWAKGKTAKEAWEQCDRADWLLWWAFKENHDIRSFTLAKARCAKLILHLMKDPRSINAVHVAEQFGLGQASEKDLRNAASACSVSAYAAYAAASPNFYGADITMASSQAKCLEIIREIIKPNFIN